REIRRGNAERRQLLDRRFHTLTLLSDQRERTRDTTTNDDSGDGFAERKTHDRLVEHRHFLVEPHVDILAVELDKDVTRRKAGGCRGRSFDGPADQRASLNR